MYGNKIPKGYENLSGPFWENSSFMPFLAIFGPNWHIFPHFYSKYCLKTIDNHFLGYFQGLEVIWNNKKLVLIFWLVSCPFPASQPLALSVISPSNWAWQRPHLEKFILQKPLDFIPKLRLSKQNLLFNILL